MDDLTIGQRAAEEIQNRANENKTSIRSVMADMYIANANFTKWRNCAIDPGASFLAQMLRAGFDIQYILIGERSDGKTLHSECDKGQPPL